MKVIVGLGNPGAQYDNTRHNIGFEVVDYLADGQAWKKQGKALICSITLSSQKILLVKPQTYMNLSGDAVLSVLGFFKIKPEDVLVVVDDVNLPVGSVRFRKDGSHGGQNGLRDIIAKVGKNFSRMRVGVGPVPPRWDLANFVLSRPQAQERETLNKVVQDCPKIMDTILDKDLSRAMNLYNGKDWSPPTDVVS